MLESLYINLTHGTYIDGNSEICAHVRSNFSAIWFVWGIWLDREQSQIGFCFSEKTYFPSCVRNIPELPSNMGTMTLNPSHKEKILLYQMFSYFFVWLLYKWCVSCTKKNTFHSHWGKRECVKERGREREGESECVKERDREREREREINRGSVWNICLVYLRQQYKDVNYYQL